MCKNQIFILTPVSAGSLDVSPVCTPVVKMHPTEEQQIKPGVTVFNMKRRESENSDQNFQSAFAREISEVNTSDCGFKSQFALEMQNSMVIMNDQDNSYIDTAEDDPENNAVNDRHSENYSYLEADQILTPQIPQVN